MLLLFSADVRAVEESDSKIVEGGIAAVGWRWALGIGGTGGLATCNEGVAVVDPVVTVEVGGGWTVDLRLLLRSSRC